MDAGSHFSFNGGLGKEGMRCTATLDFPGRIVKDAGFFIASFPGKFDQEWKNLLESMSASTACVFFPDGSNLNGGHARDGSTSGCCHCADLYGEEKPWGCAWFQCWKQLVHEALEQGQQPVVVYFEGEELEQSGYVEGGQLNLNVSGLGNSQAGEVRYLETVVPPANIQRVSIPQLRKIGQGDTTAWCQRCGSVARKYVKEDFGYDCIEESLTCAKCGHTMFNHSTYGAHTSENRGGELKELALYMKVLGEAITDKASSA